MPVFMGHHVKHKHLLSAVKGRKDKVGKRRDRREERAKKRTGQKQRLHSLRAPTRCLGNTTCSVGVCAHVELSV